MAHYAKVNKGIVEKVIVAEAEFFNNFVDDSPGQWIKTSYNMLGGVYYDPVTRLPVDDQSIINGDEARQRKNFASIGGTYDAINDVFIPPKPKNEGTWILDMNTYLWKRPLDYPTDGQIYFWDENLYQSDNTIGWVLKSNQGGD